MQIPAFKAEKRAASGTKAMRKLRAGGVVPGVLYGKGKENLNLQIADKDLHAMLDGSAHVVQLDFGSEKTYALIRALDQDHLADVINHVDFVRVDLSDKVRVRVPVNFIGTAKGAAHGGVMEVLRGDVELMSPADRIPAHIEVEVTHLEIGDAVRAKDLKLPEGITIHQNPNAVIVHCTHPRKVEEVAPVRVPKPPPRVPPCPLVLPFGRGCRRSRPRCRRPSRRRQGRSRPAAAAPAAKAAPKK
ncbi:MAG: 50S ribosomal protein L25 [Planctomycetes bacterium]|nr:50S ribosomal protein L25 [Planctomycetota bacterium]